MSHCATCTCESAAHREARQQREREQIAREIREREFVKRHSVLTDENMTWVRAQLGKDSADADAH